MPSPYCEIFRNHSRPLEPLPTGEAPVLKRLAGIRALLFDIYGTLLISASGEMGIAAEQHAAGPVPGSPCPLDEALEAMGIDATGPAGQGIEHLHRLIEVSHARSRSAGIDYPEVNITQLWQAVLAELARRGVIEEAAASAADPRRLAVEYEARANPCWPMPHLRECLEELRAGKLVLGLVSNAQFYTPILFEALLGSTPEELGFPRQLQYYSYEHGCAKPGTGLFERALAVLAGHQIAAGEVLYVGNDMLNDVSPASRLGLRTALFAGDTRSLRRRRELAQLEGLSPDLVLTDLMQLAQCIMI